jgi:flagellar biosynthesis/type III secretory pathway protein FliH
MRSSNWRLIREPSEAAVQLPLPAPVPPAPVAAGRGVLRGQNRAANHSNSSSGGVASMAGAGPGLSIVPGNEELVAVSEEIRRAEQAAEERGYQVGINRAETQLKASVEAAGAIVERLQAIAPERTSDIAHAIAELALSVAKRVVQHEVSLQPSLLCAALEEAVSTINGSPEAHVLLNPSAVEAVQSAWEALHGRSYLGKKWTFEGDPTLPVGGCTLRYEHGFVEAGFEAQLEEIGIALDRAVPGLARGAVEAEFE